MVVGLNSTAGSYFHFPPFLLLRPSPFDYLYRLATIFKCERSALDMRLDLLSSHTLNHANVFHSAYNEGDDQNECEVVFIAGRPGQSCTILKEIANKFSRHSINQPNGIYIKIDLVYTSLSTMNPE